MRNANDLTTVRAIETGLKADAEVIKRAPRAMENFIVVVEEYSWKEQGLNMRLDRIRCPFGVADSDWVLGRRGETAATKDL